MATEFTLFPHLITELRLEIWRMALPPPVENALYPYNEGCWTYEDVGVNPDPNGEDLNMRFDTSQLKPLHIQLPLYSVNREARDVAIDYIRRELQHTQRSTDSEFEFLRYFNPSIDTLSIPTNEVNTLVDDLIDRRHAPDMQDRYTGTAHPVISSLAITPSGLEKLKGDLMELYTMGGSIGTIYLVDTEYTDESTIREFEEASRYNFLKLEDEPRARLTWRKSHSQWEASGDDKAVAQIQSLVKDLHDGQTISDRDLDIHLVRMTSLGMASS